VYIITVINVIHVYIHIYPNTWHWDRDSPATIHVVTVIHVLSDTYVHLYAYRYKHTYISTNIHTCV
jgi:hypothetical protein